MDRYLVISSDCHAGLPPERYRDYLDPRYREAFDQALPIQIEMTRAAEKRFLVADVTRGLSTVRPGEVKALRLVAIPAKTQPRMNRPAMGLTRDDPGKAVLGTVPVEPDGSAYFRAPSGVAMFFQALDARGMAVQTMRSATHVQPGQTLSCTGCHESRKDAPPTSLPLLAALREPSRCTAPDRSAAFATLAASASIWLRISGIASSASRISPSDAQPQATS